MEGILEDPTSTRILEDPFEKRPFQTLYILLHFISNFVVTIVGWFSVMVYLCLRKYVCLESLIAAGCGQVGWLDRISAVGLTRSTGEDQSPSVSFHGTIHETRAHKIQNSRSSKVTKMDLV